MKRVLIVASLTLACLSATDASAAGLFRKRARATPTPASPAPQSSAPCCGTAAPGGVPTAVPGMSMPRMSMPGMSMPSAPGAATRSGCGFANSLNCPDACRLPPLRLSAGSW